MILSFSEIPRTRRFSYFRKIYGLVFQKNIFVFQYSFLRKTTRFFRSLFRYSENYFVLKKTVSFFRFRKRVSFSISEERMRFLEKKNSFSDKPNDFLKTETDFLNTKMFSEKRTHFSEKQILCSE